MTEACIFDLDGVLVDTAKFHYLSWQKLATNIGINFSEIQNEQLKGVSRMDSLDLILQWGQQVASHEQKIKLADQKNQWYLEFIEDLDGNSSLPHVIDFLEHLKSSNIKLAVGSASKNARFVISKLKLNDYFECIVGGNDVKKTKPDPEVFLNAAKFLQVQPENTIVFEDSEKGIEAAINGHFKAVGIGEYQNLSEAHMVIPNFRGIYLDSFIPLFN